MSVKTKSRVLIHFERPKSKIRISDPVETRTKINSFKWNQGNAIVFKMHDENMQAFEKGVNETIESGTMSTIPNNIVYAYAFGLESGRYYGGRIKSWETVRAPS